MPKIIVLRAQFLFFLLYGHQFCGSCLLSVIVVVLSLKHAILSSQQWLSCSSVSWSNLRLPTEILSNSTILFTNHREIAHKKSSHCGLAHVCSAGRAVTSLTRPCGPSAITPTTRWCGTWFCSPSCWAWGSCSWCSAASRWSTAALAASAGTAATEKMYVRQTLPKWPECSWRKERRREEVLLLKKDSRLRHLGFNG